MRTLLNKMFNEQNNNCARVLLIFIHFLAVLFPFRITHCHVAYLAWACFRAIGVLNRYTQLQISLEKFKTIFTRSHPRRRCRRCLSFLLILTVYDGGRSFLYRFYDQKCENFTMASPTTGMFRPCQGQGIIRDLATNSSSIVFEVTFEVFMDTVCSLVGEFESLITWWAEEDRRNVYFKYTSYCAPWLFNLRSVLLGMDCIWLNNHSLEITYHKRYNMLWYKETLRSIGTQCMHTL